MPAPRGEREWAPSDVPERPRTVDVGARGEDRLDEADGAPPRDRVVEAAALVHVGAPLDEPAEPVEVLEVDLVPDVLLRAGLPEGVEHGRRAVLARMVDRVVVPLGAVLDEELDQRDVVAVDRAPDGVEVPAAAVLVLVRVRVRVGAGLEQQARALPDVRAGPGRSPEQVQERDEAVDGLVRRPWVVGEDCGEPGRVGEREPAFDALEREGLDVPDEARPAREAVVARELVLRRSEGRPPFALARLRLLAQVLEVGAVGKLHGEPPVLPGSASRAEGSSSRRSCSYPVGCSLPRGRTRPVARRQHTPGRAPHDAWLQPVERSSATPRSTSRSRWYVSSRLASSTDTQRATSTSCANSSEPPVTRRRQ